LRPCALAPLRPCAPSFPPSPCCVTWSATQRVANAVMEQGKGVAALTILWPVMSMAVLMAHLEGWQYVARRHTHSLA
jgi:hypothetical protein